MSAPSVCRLPRAGGMRLSRPQHTITSPDPEYALKKGRSRPRGGVRPGEAFHCADEFNISRHPTIGPSGARSGGG